MIDIVQPLSLPTLEQLPAIKACIKDAAFFTRDALNFYDSGGRENRRLTLESISRAIWNEDLGLARKLLATTALAKEHIQIQDNRVCIINPPVLEEAYRVEREYYLGNRINEARSALPRASITEAAKLKGKISAARRQQTTFFAKKPFVNLVGLRIKRPGSIIEDIVTDPIPIQRGLISYWGPIYIAKPQNSAAIQKLLDVYSRHVAPTLHFDSISLPATEDYRDNILAQKDSSPGPDGVRFCAYKAISDTAAAALKNLAGTFASSPPLPPPPLLPLSLHVFLATCPA